jgi:radical SAM protein with 4Fe4S-binding SPASM domain
MKFKKKHLTYLTKDISLRRKLKVLEWNLRQHDLWGPFPLYAKIEIDQRCNLKCPKCYRDEVVNNKFMTMDQFKEVLDKLGSGLCEVWTHGFGEPTMHPQFLDMMKEVRNRGMIWGLATNGATKFFDSNNNIGELLAMYPSKIRFSVDAATKTDFERERFPAKFDKVMDNIKKVVTMRDALQFGNNKSRIDLYCVLTMQTLDQIEPMIRLRNELKCDWVTFSDLAWNNDYGTSVENNAVRQMMTPEEIERMIVFYKDLPKVNFNIPRPDLRTCDYTKKHIYIDAEGWIYPCTCVPGKEKPFANIFEIDNIKEIYQSVEYDIFREYSKKGHITSDECFRCLQWGPDYSDI